MLKKTLALTALLVFLGLPGLARASSSIVIESYKIAGTKSTDEYVELYNPTGATVSITGWQLAKKTAGGTKYALVTSFPVASINPGESLIVGHADSTNAPDILYTTGYSISEDNTIILYSDAGKTVVDKVGFGKAGEFESAPAPTAGTDTWFRQNGLDTDNNLADFQKSSGPSYDYSGLVLSELSPSSKDGDEWIEIYNSEIQKDIGGLIIADKLGSVKQYTVLTGTLIGEDQYLVFYKKDTGITLNDDGDGAVLIDGTGKVFDDTGESYGKIVAGDTWASDGTAWHWTTTPTPGAPNKITAVNNSTAISSKKVAQPTANAASSSQKGTLPSTAVLGASTAGSSSNDLFSSKGSSVPLADQIFGEILIGVALAGGLGYTIYVNREKLSATFVEERKRYAGTWDKLREKMSGWRTIFTRR